jgi:hypothetical protein
MKKKDRERLEKARDVAVAYVASQGYERCSATLPYPPPPGAEAIYVSVTAARLTQRGNYAGPVFFGVKVHLRGYQGTMLVPEIVDTTYS